MQKTPLAEISVGEIMRIEPVRSGETVGIKTLLQRIASRLGLVP
jgi:hypothetical protein